MPHTLRKTYVDKGSWPILLGPWLGAKMKWPAFGKGKNLEPGEAWYKIPMSSLKLNKRKTINNHSSTEKADGEFASASVGASRHKTYANKLPQAYRQTRDGQAYQLLYVGVTSE